MNTLLFTSFTPTFLAVSETVCAALWRASWQGAIGVAVIAVVCRVFPQLPATARCWMWRLALLKFVLTLLFPIALPLRVLPARALAARPAPIVTAIAPTEENRRIASTIQKATVNPASEEQAAPTTGEEVTTPPARTLRLGTTAVTHAPPQEFGMFPMATAPKAVPLFALFSSLLLFLYATGVAVCVFRLIRNALQTPRFLRSNCRPCDDVDTTYDLAALSERIGWRRNLRLVAAAGITSSQLVAGVPPILLMPPATADTEARRLMIAHELAHLKRHDLVWAAFSALAHTLFFFHPGVWFARREEELAREIACDALAVAATRSSTARYGALFVEVVTQNRSSHHALRATASLGIANDVAQIGRRLVALQTLGTPVSARRLRLLLSVSAAATLLVILPYRFVAAQNARQPHLLATVAPTRAMFDANNSASVIGRIYYGKSKLDCTQAEVLLKYLPDTPPPTRISSWQKYAHTDADGRFQFTNLLPGRYRVLTRGEFGAWSPLSSVQATVLTLKAQEHRVLPDIALERQVQVIGRIVDAQTGQPITDVMVAGGSADRNGQVAADADWQQVDSDGQYKAYVPAGKSAIYLHRTMYQSRTYTGRRWTSEYALPESAGIVRTVCTARQDQAMQLDIKVAAIRVSASTPVLPPIKGKVIGAEGHAIGGAQVFLFAAKNWGSIAPVVRTDAQGVFTIGNLDPKWAGEALMIRARHTGRGLMSHPVSLTLPASGAAPFITVPLVAHLAGSIEGRVVDAAGHPLPFVIVNLYTGGSYVSIDDHAVTDSDGRYQFAGLWPDLYAYPKADKTDYGVDSQPSVNNFPVGVNQHRQVTPLVLYPGDQSIAGRMTYQDGAPLANVGVSATRGDSLFAHTDTDAQGRFRINHLSAGPLRLYFQKGVAQFIEAKTGDLHIQVVVEGKSKP